VSQGLSTQLSHWLYCLLHKDSLLLLAAKQSSPVAQQQLTSMMCSLFKLWGMIS
jgi:hypothetical protein